KGNIGIVDFDKNALKPGRSRSLSRRRRAFQESSDYEGIQFILRWGDVASPGMVIEYMTAPLEILKSRRHANGIWGYQSDQAAIEPTCLALLALRRETGTEITTAVRVLQSLQNADGSWSAFACDEATGCWTTTLTMLTLLAIGGRSDTLASAIHWLINAKGRESSWFWRWKFKTVDKSVQFDPAKYGWSWVLATTSWV